MSVATATNLQGAKIALLCGAKVVSYLRDDFAHIPNPGEWDLPGGEREPGETALLCALRETQEEFGLQVPPGAIHYETTFWAPAAARVPRRQVAFFVAEIDQALVDRIVFGEEGQRWEMMPTETFTTRPDGVAELRACLAAYLEGQR